LGAFITIVALAIDPFSQQIIQYYDCSVLISGAKAIIPTSNFYMGGSYFPNGDAQIPTPQMSAAIYVGLLDPPPNGSSNLLVDCSTGNCTFPETTGASYSSIAMCSSCADISPTIINGTYWDNTYGMIGNYSLPSGPMLLADKPDILNSTIVSEGNDAMGNYSVPRAAPLIIIETLMARTQAQNLATRCSFSPCVNTYGGNITNGILQERLVSSTPLAIYGGGFTQWFSLITNKTLRGGAWHECSSADHYSTEYPIGNAASATPFNFSGTEMPYHTFYPSDCVWTLGLTSTGGLMSTLLELFNDTVSNIDDIPDGPIWLVDLWNNGTASLETVQKSMDGLTYAISDQFRQQGDNSTAGLVSGTVYGMQTCIRVQWAWIALPAQMSFSNARRIWRSSSLALLFHGFSTETLQRDGGVASSNTLEERAGATQAQLRYANGDWEFFEYKGGTI